MDSLTLDDTISRQRMKLCKDCRWHQGNATHPELATCFEPRSYDTNFVTGERKPNYCGVMRTCNNIGCGESAKWWQPISRDDVQRVAAE